MVGEAAKLVNALKDVVLGFLSEAFEGGEAILFAGLLEFIEGVDLELFVEEFYFFGAEAWDFEDFKEPGGSGVYEIFVEG